jgi:aspartate/methionine/tyrosine aminotransferase
LLAVAERRRNRVGTGEPATALVPIPTFSCPLDQMALQGMRVHLLPPVDGGMDPSPEAVARVPESVEVDAVYAMPITNPTGRTIDPGQMRAFVVAVLDRWPHAAVILDSVYVRLHPRHRELLGWYTEDPRFRSSVIFIDSLSKTHGVTGLRAGALLTHAEDLARAANRYAQNVMAGPSNTMQAVVLSLLAPFATGDEAMQDSRIRLQLRIGRHLQRRRRLLLTRTFASCGEYLDGRQPVLPDPETFDWEGSRYAVLRLSEMCLAESERRGVPPTVGFYIDTGVAGVPLEGFCSNANLVRHGLVSNQDDSELREFQKESRRYVRLSFGMTPPPRVT